MAPAAATTKPRTAARRADRAAGQARDIGAHLLPYQQAWVRDESDMKLWSKSRRIGADYSEAAGVTLSRASGRRTLDYWYSSADESAAYEFIRYVQDFCRIINFVVEITTDEVWQDDRLVRVMSVEIPTPQGAAARIVAMTSNPKRFRSKGGDVCLSEAAHHEDLAGMWAAAQPAATWGGRIAVLSSHNGDTHLFNQWRQMALRRLDPAAHGAARAGDMPWSFHETTIDDAIAQGLVERINLTRGTDYTRESFRAKLRAQVDQQTWEQEYLCRPSREADSFFPYDLLRPCVDAADAPVTGSLAEFLEGVRQRVLAWRADDLFLGCDVGRVSDPFALAARARVGGRLRLAGMLSFTGRSFAEMEFALRAALDADLDVGGRRPIRPTSLAIDETGLGMQLAERLREAYGHRVEPVTITANVKREIITLARRGVEERTTTLPDDGRLLGEYNAVRQTRTAAGNDRYDGSTDEGHLDCFIADCLAQHAAEIIGHGARWVPTLGRGARC